MDERPSLREQRIRRMTRLYYSRPDIQKALFEFSKDREVVARYFEGFGKRPDTLQYIGDISELVKKGATSFHCSEELWEEVLKVSTSMSEKQLDDLRTGWDMILDIDSRYIDYSKILAREIIRVLKFHGVKNIGVKFSGSKGFHILIPWKAFPKKVNEIRTADMFPEWPRIITQYLVETTRKELIEKITKLNKPSRYIKDFEAPREVMPDMILVSPRHLFRMPYSLHEKTALASVVLKADEILKFDLRDADPMKVSVRNFLPDVEEGEARELLIQALDWYKGQYRDIEKPSRGRVDFKPVKLDNLSDMNFPPSVKKILQGMQDGRKRALFILINFFRSIGMEKQELEQRIEKWNQKNEVPLKQGYIKSQLVWSYRNKIVPPPNFDKIYYRGIGIIPTPEELRLKNPTSYFVRKTFQEQRYKKPAEKKRGKKFPKN